MSEVNPRLRVIFNQHLGVDIASHEYDEFRVELADFFKGIVRKSILEATQPLKGDSK